jgi:hypothetical protein
VIGRVRGPCGTDGSTFVTITESGFAGAGDELMKQVASSTEGFTLVLAGIKALLEHNVVLNLVADRFPKGSQNDEDWIRRRRRAPGRIHQCARACSASERVFAGRRRHSDERQRL